MSAGIRSTPSGWCRIPSPGLIGSYSTRQTGRGMFLCAALVFSSVRMTGLLCSVWDAILHDIRKAHEHDIDSTPDYSLAKKMGLEIRKAIQSSGDYLGKVWAVIFNMLGMDFYKLSPDEQKTFKKVLSKSPAIKNSPVNFRRKRK